MILIFQSDHCLTQSTTFFIYLLCFFLYSNSLISINGDEDHPEY